MEEVKQFLETIFTKEQEAYYLEYFKDKIEAYNEAAKEINAFGKDYYDEANKLNIPFNIIAYSKSPWPDRFYEKAKNKPVPSKRHLYKISEYNNETYGNVWACYTSVPKPITKTVKSMSSCLIVSKIGDNYKIIAEFITDPDTHKWRFVGGDRNIDYYKLGKPTAIERLMSPEIDEWSIEEYNKDR
jgi:hypothetical protein